MKIIHTADIHLGSQMRGLDPTRDAGEDVSVEEIRRAPERAFSGLIDLALEEAVDAVLIAGDLFDGTWKDNRTGLAFVRQCNLLADAGIRCILVHGNHDAQSPITSRLKLPANVKVLSSLHPETWRDDRLGLAVHGQSFPKPETTANLAANYPKPLGGLCNIGLLHTAADGVTREHAPYAPCRPGDLAAHGYQYWALGHVHQRTILVAEPPVVFCGNLQGRHARECGERGFVLVEIDDATGRATPRFVTGDVVRWAHLQIDAAELRSIDEIYDRAVAAMRTERTAAGTRPLALRVEITGATSLHARLARSDPDELRANLILAADTAGGGFWLEKVVLGTSPSRDLQQLTTGASELGLLLKAIEHEEAMTAANPVRLDGWTKLLDDLARLLPPDCDAEEPLLDALRRRDYGALLGRARQRALVELADLGGREP